ncbi:hypothetical protein EVAR_3953_1 [Eumeta japonica]|uniref:Uncharacterized protein n=1 Tax=Eumeta variegata TaxID=151549 RepID=A0A4C1SR52_EUMVA|nr:hypothetical protein EVAR_3953_1 [Eumeta japonica]
MLRVQIKRKLFFLPHNTETHLPTIFSFDIRCSVFERSGLSQCKQKADGALVTRRCGVSGIEDLSALRATKLVVQRGLHGVPVIGGFRAASCRHLPTNPNDAGAVFRRSHMSGDEFTHSQLKGKQVSVEAIHGLIVSVFMHTESFAYFACGYGCICVQSISPRFLSPDHDLEPVIVLDSDPALGQDYNQVIPKELAVTSKTHIPPLNYFIVK